MWGFVVAGQHWCAAAEPERAAPVEAEGGPRGVGGEIPAVERWGMFEVTLAGSREYGNPFAGVELRGRFTGPSGRAIDVLGFHDGGRTWRLRFMPGEPGDWRYEAAFSDGSPGARGTFRCVEGKLRGPLRVDRENPLWFEHAGGEPAYLCSFHIWHIDELDEAVLSKTLDFLRSRGFNAVVGPHLVARKRLPWMRKPDGGIDFSRFDLAVWRDLDRVLRMLSERGMTIIPFNILGATNGMPKVPTAAEEDLFLRYWTSRWGGFWNATYQPTSEWEEGYSEAEMLRIGARLRELDGGRHLISAHSLGSNPEAVQRASWLDYHTVQDKLMRWDPMRFTSLVDLHRKVGKPVFAHECLWEGNLYQEKAGLDEDNMRRGAWVIALSGGQINYADEVIHPRDHQRRNETRDFYALVGARMEPLGRLYGALEILTGFIRSIPFSRMAPRPELSSTRVCLADPAGEYAVYFEKGGRGTVDLTRAGGPLASRWLDPRGGAAGAPFPVEPGGIREFAAPDGNDWVLHLRRG